MTVRLINDRHLWDERTATHRLDQLLTWVRANQLPLDDIPVDRPLTIETDDEGREVIRYFRLLRNERGHRYEDPATGDAAVEECTAPLVLEPSWPVLGEEEPDV